MDICAELYELIYEYSNNSQKTQLNNEFNEKFEHYNDSLVVRNPLKDKSPFAWSAVIPDNDTRYTSKKNKLNIYNYMKIYRLDGQYITSTFFSLPARYYTSMI